MGILSIQYMGRLYVDFYDHEGAILCVSISVSYAR